MLEDMRACFTSDAAVLASFAHQSHVLQRVLVTAQSAVVTQPKRAFAFAVAQGQFETLADELTLLSNSANWADLESVRMAPSCIACSRHHPLALASGGRSKTISASSCVVCEVMMGGSASLNLRVRGGWHACAALAMLSINRSRTRSSPVCRRSRL